MIKNYLKTAFRQLVKNKGYSFLNIFGLSLGITCAMLILLWINDEYQYNTFHKNYSQLYKVMEHQTYDGKTYTFGALPGKFGPAIKDEIPAVKYAARANWGSREVFSLGDKSIYEKGFFTDPDFLKMFSFNILKGDTANLLTEPDAIVITNTMAEKFFGNADPIGKVLKIDNFKLVTIKGVIEEPPLSSTLQFSWLAPFFEYEKRNEWLQSWGNNGVQTFAMLEKQTDATAVNSTLYNFIQQKDSSAIAKPFLLPMKDWRLKSEFEDGKQTAGKTALIKLLGIIGLLIIVIACINFMNLATARSEQRAREVGVRKSMGANRGMLIRQFFGEALFMSFLAMLIAAIIIWLVLPAFNTVIEKKLSFHPADPVVAGSLLLIALLCGLLAGSYPALYLSSFNPVTVFKGLRIGKNAGGVRIRKGLVITQFIISIVLIICTITIYRQLQHVKTRDLGFAKENVLYTGLSESMAAKFPVILNELKATNTVENAALSNGRVLNIGSSSGDFRWKGKAPESQLLVSTNWVSPQFISTMGMDLIEGRNFKEDISSDSNSIIINETFAKIIGKKQLVGEIINRDSDEELEVVGVVKDFVFNDMYKTPEPLILFCDTSNVNILLIRLNDQQDISTAVSSVGNVIKENNPGYPFEYNFMDEDFDKLFKNETMMSKLSGLFAILTILISCLGLFGLAAYTAELRTKEIGIRKVLGASVGGIVNLMTKDFLKLVFVAALIAFPLAWWMMDKFLQNFAYRINIHWTIFAIAGFLSILIALLTVSSQAIKAAIANPVKSLRTE